MMVGADDPIYVFLLRGLCASLAQLLEHRRLHHSRSSTLKPQNVFRIHTKWFNKRSYLKPF